MAGITRALLIALCVLGCGCNIRRSEPAAPTVNASQIIIVTATPAPAVQSIEPTQPPPTLDAPRQFANAEALTRNGYLEEAADAYLQLVNSPDSSVPSQRAAAIFRYGQVALRAGFFQQAQDAFSLFIAENPASAQIAQAWFLRGDARLGLSMWTQAIEDLRQYLKLRPGTHRQLCLGAHCRRPTRPARHRPGAFELRAGNRGETVACAAAAAARKAGADSYQSGQACGRGGAIRGDSGGGAQPTLSRGNRLERGAGAAQRRE